jgi:hypothetical protein
MIASGARRMAQLNVPNSTTDQSYDENGDESERTEIIMAPCCF